MLLVFHHSRSPVKSMSTLSALRMSEQNVGNTHSAKSSTLVQPRLMAHSNRQAPQTAVRERQMLKQFHQSQCVGLQQIVSACERYTWGVSLNAASNKELTLSCLFTGAASETKGRELHCRCNWSPNASSVQLEEQSRVQNSQENLQILCIFT